MIAGHGGRIGNGLECPLSSREQAPGSFVADGTDERGRHAAIDAARPQRDHCRDNPCPACHAAAPQSRLKHTTLKPKPKGARLKTGQAPCRPARPVLIFPQRQIAPTSREHPP